VIKAPAATNQIDGMAINQRFANKGDMAAQREE